jgi:hypothetical protein
MSSHDRTGLPAVGSRSTEAPPTRPVATVSRPRPARITDRHGNKLAIVDVRQSSPQQVFDHKESRERQYAMADHAVALGWPRDRVLVIDEDQGRSGKSTGQRLGFQHLLAEVTMDHVDLVLGLELCRLSRSSKDWYHLVEVCRPSHPPPIPPRSSERPRPTPRARSGVGNSPRRRPPGRCTACGPGPPSRTASPPARERRQDEVGGVHEVDLPVAQRCLLQPRLQLALKEGRLVAGVLGDRRCPSGKAA